VRSREPRPEIPLEDYQIPDFFSRKRMEEELRQSRDELEERVIKRTAELAEANRRLLQAQKLEAVGRLAGGIAHDFNNLLALVLMRTSILQSRVAPSSSMWAELDEIRAACDRGAALSRQLLAFSRRQPTEQRPLELGHLVKELQRTMLPLVGEDIEAITEVGGEAHIEGDPSQLEQVLMNLVVNARDAMPRGGTLRVSVDTVDLGRTAIATGELPAGSYARLRVADTGTGMDAETMARIFDPFFTTKSDEHGTGLGLSTVYGIVKQAGGGVDVESRAGKGTTFTVLLPTTAARPQPRSTAVSAAVAVRPRARILVVEDQDDLRAAIEDALAMAGHEVIAAGGADDAIAALQHATAPFDILLTDLVMPKTSGRELADHVRARWPGIHILFMSGYERDQLGDPGRDNGGQVMMLRKPFSIGELERRIADLLRR
jgi:two-component system cell cycle sensor histidine kinase/response regulator CckA